MLSKPWSYMSEQKTLKTDVRIAAGSEICEKTHSKKMSFQMQETKKKKKKQPAEHAMSVVSPKQTPFENLARASGTDESRTSSRSQEKQACKMEDIRRACACKRQKKSILGELSRRVCSVLFPFLAPPVMTSRNSQWYPPRSSLSSKAQKRNSEGRINNAKIEFQRQLPKILVKNINAVLIRYHSLALKIFPIENISFVYTCLYCLMCSSEANSGVFLRPNKT